MDLTMDERSIGQPSPTTLPAPVESASTSKVNIYRDHILPLIGAAAKGERIFFVSPSTFFGFDSLGAGNFDAVCRALQSAKAKGVQIRILIDVRDSFAAKAAEGLLLFLDDGEEVKELQENVNLYSILLYKPDGESRFASFDSDPPQMLPFLPGIQTRRFRKVRSSNSRMSDEESQNHIREFQFLWKLPSTRTVSAAVYTYSPEFRTRLKFSNLQRLSYGISFFAGILFGIFLMVPGTAKYAAIVGLIVSLASGVISNLLTNYFTKKKFD
jgi:hypothetical protein